MVSRTRAEKFKRFADAGTFVPYQDMERRSRDHASQVTSQLLAPGISTDAESELQS
jgi:hypothetical protein